MTPTASKDPTPAGEETEVIYHHRRGPIITLVLLLSGLLGLFVFAAFYGSGFEPNSSDPIWALLLGFLLLCLLFAVLWIMWKRPIFMIVSGAGLHLPFAFERPIRWDEIHRIRLVPRVKSLYGNRQWLIVDPSPGVLAPIRLKSWRRLDLWFQKHHGVRIPLHGLDADADSIVQSIEHYRPVIRHGE
ncbi:MAG: hypothetical protein KJN90_02840 [Gammaproteobacteria bacterium]|nr:hypothetical protein [Gammaproteobacteria bacterium]